MYPLYLDQVLPLSHETRPHWDALEAPYTLQYFIPTHIINFASAKKLFMSLKLLSCNNLIATLVDLYLPLI